MNTTRGSMCKHPVQCNSTCRQLTRRSPPAAYSMTMPSCDGIKMASLNCSTRQTTFSHCKACILHTAWQARQYLSEPGHELHPSTGGPVSRHALELQEAARPHLDDMRVHEA